MYHQHFNTIASTQIYLKDNLISLREKAEDILISCSNQTEGIGRRGNTWHSYSNSLAMSFTLKPNHTPTLTPLEIGIIAVEFFKKHLGIQLFLKWPNDILTSDGKKCGGIICQYVDNSTVIVGLGINIGKIESKGKDDYRHGLGSVDQNLVLGELDQEKLSKDLYFSFIENRFHNEEDLKLAFNRYCYHMNKEVYVFENEKDNLGIFRGIGKNGEALVEIESTIHSFLSSSLTILD